MRFIHCADLHLDSKMTSNLSREQAKERKMEILRTYSRMIDYAKENKIDGIIIAGDLFDTRNISATARNMVKDSIMSNPQIEFYYLKGNHDSDNFFSKLDDIPENLHLFNEEWKAYDYGSISLSGIEIDSTNESTLYNSLVLDNDKYNIVIMHGQIGQINLNAMKNKGIDYLALGHVHEYQNGPIDNRGIYCYSGCLEGRGFDECGAKGFVVLDIDEQKLTAGFSFIPFAYRNLYTIYVDVTGAMTTQDAAAKIEDELAKNPYSSRSLVKIVLVGEVDVDCEINTDFLKDMFEEYFYYEKVYDETKLLINYSDYEKDVSLKGEFIRMVLQSDMSEEKKSEVIRCGIMALSGEEI